MEAHFTKPLEEEQDKHSILLERSSSRDDVQLKYEVLVLIYRVVAMALGTVLMVVSYLLFITVLFANGEMVENATQWLRIGPPMAFFFVGLFICMAGCVRWMRLPKYQAFRDDAYRRGEKGDGDDIPVLAPLKVSQLNDKVWTKNVKPLMEKVVNKEHITSSERELLRNWLKSQ